MLDRRIVEFAISIPEELFEPRDGYSRFLFRSAIAELLPRDVAWAPKYPSPKHFEMRKRLWLAALGLLLKNDKGLFDIDHEFIDGKRLYKAIEEIVRFNSTDFENIKNGGVVAPAIAIAVLNKARRSAGQ